MVSRITKFVTLQNFNNLNNFYLELKKENQLNLEIYSYVKVYGMKLKIWVSYIDTFNFLTLTNKNDESEYINYATELFLQEFNV